MYTKTEYSDNQLLKMMQQAGLRPSLHRIAVLSFVANSRSHPSADEVYTRLSKQFPTMSRTTIYNALHALVETSLLRELEIESGTMRYDLAPKPGHGHFICRKCGKIYDTEMPDGLMSSVSPGFCIDCIDIFYKGLCPMCTTEQH